MGLHHQQSSNIEQSGQSLIEMSDQTKLDNEAWFNQLANVDKAKVCAYYLRDLIETDKLKIKLSPDYNNNPAIKANILGVQIVAYPQPEDDYSIYLVIEAFQNGERIDAATLRKNLQRDTLVQVFTDLTINQVTKATYYAQNSSYFTEKKIDPNTDRHFQKALPFDHVKLSLRLNQIKSLIPFNQLDAARSIFEKKKMQEGQARDKLCVQLPTCSIF